MEFYKTRRSRPWNSDQNCTQNSAMGVKGLGGGGSRGGRGSEGERMGLKGGGEGVLGVVGSEWGLRWG